jgi:hypothetical protein
MLELTSILTVFIIDVKTFEFVTVYVGMIIARKTAKITRLTGPIMRCTLLVTKPLNYCLSCMPQVYSGSIQTAGLEQQDNGWWLLQSWQIEVMQQHFDICCF